MRRLGTTILTAVLAGCFSLADYVPVLAEETVAEAQEKSLEQKIKEAEKLVKDSPSAQAYIDLGDLYGKLKRREEQADAYRVSWEKYSHLGGLASWGAVLTYQEKYKEAEELFSKGVEANEKLPLDKRESLVHYNYGCLLGVTERWKAAIEQFDKALEINKGYKKAESSRDYCLKQLRLSQRN